MTRPGGCDALFRATAMSDLPALEALIERACTRVGASAEVLSELRLAVEEVFTNILRHGYRSSTGPITVTVTTTPLAIAVTLADAAPDFDPASLAVPDTSSDWQGRQVGGLGWHLVHQVMDEVRRAPGSHGGNVYTLVKKIRARPTPGALIS
ncbi:ATP-binding protein [Ottowia thiooxydans]|uniref:Anti-sigma regulatory factor (Ser/Thr protein kinase) n=1 Tax=Ottowia thiooxydans TaxID=219182 RepID=A0ABV2Q5E1_9BURK